MTVVEAALFYLSATTESSKTSVTLGSGMATIGHREPRPALHREPTTRWRMTAPDTAWFYMAALAVVPDKVTLGSGTETRGVRNPLRLSPRFGGTMRWRMTVLGAAPFCLAAIATALVMSLPLGSGTGPPGNAEPQLALRHEAGQA